MRCVLVMLLAVVLTVGGTDAWAQSPPKPEVDMRKVAAQVRGGQTDAALAAVRQALDEDARRATLGMGDVLKALVESGQGDAAALLALEGILAAPYDPYRNAGIVEDLQTWRVKALLAAGRKAEALAEAKALYNVCSMDGTGEAIDLIARILDEVNGQEAGVSAKFRLEQLRGSTTQPAVGPATVASDASVRPAPQGWPRGQILASIKVDGSAYETILRELDGDDFATLTARGNILLLADRPDEAWQVFQRAREASTARQLPHAAENLARCMRAQDGCIGRANAWILSIRPSQPAETRAVR